MNFTRGLIINKFYLDKIFDNGKTWEMRTTKTNIRGNIGLIEAGTGLIVGEADLTGCSSVPIINDKSLIKFHHVENFDLLDKWRYAWYLENAKRFKQPLPYIHPKGAVIWVKF
jgi:hypothetical protein